MTTPFALKSCPTAQQSDVLAHEMSLSAEIPLGKRCGPQVIPPSVVATTTAPPEERWPTAQQSDAVTHESENNTRLPVGSA
jgi:hypothetical protein